MTARRLKRVSGSATGRLLVALRQSARKIIVFLFVVLAIVTIVGAFMYQVEGERNRFTSIPAAMYWAIGGVRRRLPSWFRGYLPRKVARFDCWRSRTWMQALTWSLAFCRMRALPGRFFSAKNFCASCEGWRRRRRRRVVRGPRHRKRRSSS